MNSHTIPAFPEGPVQARCATPIHAVSIGHLLGDVESKLAYLGNFLEMLYEANDFDHTSPDEVRRANGKISVLAYALEREVTEAKQLIADLYRRGADFH